MTGMDESVFNYVMDNETARIFANKLEDMTEFLIPKYAQEGKTSLVIAIRLYRRKAPFCYHCKGVIQPSLPETGNMASGWNTEMWIRMRLLEEIGIGDWKNVFFRDGERRTFQAHRLRQTLQGGRAGGDFIFFAAAL